MYSHVLFTGISQGWSTLEEGTPPQRCPGRSFRTTPGRRDSFKAANVAFVISETNYLFSFLMDTTTDNVPIPEPQKCPSLPPDLWRVIAGHLPLDEWARVSAVCKTTWHLQLETVDLWWLQEGGEMDRAGDIGDP